ncbi:MAG: hypothetical protein HYV26_23330 [Candidatus Hydrogenedentes bacterium]|nr:hypothetical protein [Candidatus Hydrogenedentota bacterium]
MSTAALDEKLLTIIENMRQREKLQRSLETLEKQLERERTRWEGLERELQQEQQDVTALEGLTLTALFYAVLGSKEAQLEKERQGLLATKLRFDECAQAVAALKKDLTQRRDQQLQLGDVEREYERVLAEREAAIQAGSGTEVRQLQGIIESIARAREEERQMGDAVQAGERALEALDDLRGALAGAEGWGLWDIFGGGVLVAAAKHSRINDAKQIAHHAQQYLRRFEAELTGLQRVDDLTPAVGDFVTFADFFFDGLISDWIVQSRIHSSAEAVERAIDKVHWALTGLRVRWTQSTETRTQLEAERRDLLQRPL